MVSSLRTAGAVVAIVKAVVKFNGKTTVYFQDSSQIFRDLEWFEVNTTVA